MAQQKRGWGSKSNPYRKNGKGVTTSSRQVRRSLKGYKGTGEYIPAEYCGKCLKVVDEGDTFTDIRPSWKSASHDLYDFVICASCAATLSGIVDDEAAFAWLTGKELYEGKSLALEAMAKKVADLSDADLLDAWNNLGVTVDGEHTAAWSSKDMWDEVHHISMDVYAEEIYSNMSKRSLTIEDARARAEESFVDNNQNWL